MCESGLLITEANGTARLYIRSGKRVTLKRNKRRYGVINTLGQDVCSKSDEVLWEAYWHSLSFSESLYYKLYVLKNSVKSVNQAHCICEVRTRYWMSITDAHVQ